MLPNNARTASPPMTKTLVALPALVAAEVRSPGTAGTVGPTTLVETEGVLGAEVVDEVEEGFEVGVAVGPVVEGVGAATGFPLRSTKVW